MAKIKLAIVTPAAVSVPVANTAVPLSAVALLATNISVQWHPSNVGNIFLGDATAAVDRGILLNSSTPAVGIDADDTAADEDMIYFDLNKIYINAPNAGDKVLLSYMIVDSVDYNAG